MSVRSPVSSLWCSCVNGPVSSGASKKVCSSSSDSSDSGEGGHSQCAVSEGNGTVVDVVDDGGGRLSSAHALVVSSLRIVTSSTSHCGSGGLALSGQSVSIWFATLHRRSNSRSAVSSRVAGPLVWKTSKSTWILI